MLRKLLYYMYVCLQYMQNLQAIFLQHLCDPFPSLLTLSCASMTVTCPSMGALLMHTQKWSILATILMLNQNFLRVLWEGKFTSFSSILPYECVIIVSSTHVVNFHVHLISYFWSGYFWGNYKKPILLDCKWQSTITYYDSTINSK